MPDIPKPDPSCPVPTTDSRVLVRFLGNTAQIAESNFVQIDPFQLFALAKWLERTADRMLTMSEQQEARNRIAVAGRIPPGLKKPGG
jgi:hypothetical protein